MDTTPTPRGTLSPLFTWRGAIASPQSQLHPTTRLVAFAMSLHMNEKGGSAYPTQQQLSDETGLHKQTVREHLAILRDQGWLVPLNHASRGKAVEWAATIPEKVWPSTTPLPERCSPEHPKGVVEDYTQDVNRTLEVQETTSLGRDAGKKPRPRDPLWDALEDTVGKVTNELERGRRNKALKALRESGATADQVRNVVRNYRNRWPGVELTAMGIASNWSLLTNESSALTPLERLELVRRHAEEARGETDTV